MDPNANLREQRTLAKFITAMADRESVTIEDMTEFNKANFRLAELVVALDEWIAKGGVLPKRWQR